MSHCSDSEKCKQHHALEMGFSSVFFAEIFSHHFLFATNWRFKGNYLIQKGNIHLGNGAKERTKRQIFNGTIFVSEVSFWRTFRNCKFGSLQLKLILGPTAAGKEISCNATEMPWRNNWRKECYTYYITLLKEFKI